MPDELIGTSFATLLAAGFLPCTQSSDCHYLNTLRCPSPTAHLHINDELTLSLFRKFDVLPEFPDFTHASNCKESDIMHASDPRLPPASLGRGQGLLSSDLSSVRIPSPLRYCEAIIFLLCRDHDSPCETYWMAILTYILEFIDGLDIFDEEELREDYRQFYHAIKHGDSRMFLLLDGLRRDLIERRILSASQV